jgi:hypothetical protein
MTASGGGRLTPAPAFPIPNIQEVRGPPPGSSP